MDRGAKRDWQIRLAALAIFLLGFTAGALAFTIYQNAQRDAGPEPRRRFGQVLDQLDLSEEQRSQVRAIFDDARARMSEIRRESAPKFREVREQTDARLREVMTPEQWERFSSLTSEGRERRRRGRGERSGAPPAGPPANANQGP